MVPACPFATHRLSTELSWFPMKSVEVESCSHREQKKPQHVLNWNSRQVLAETIRSCDAA
jgi:hypothetical protein